LFLGIDGGLSPKSAKIQSFFKFFSKSPSRNYFDSEDYWLKSGPFKNQKALKTFPVFPVFLKTKARFLIFDASKHWKKK